jgi:hypothetical protein
MADQWRLAFRDERAPPAAVPVAYLAGRMVGTCRPRPHQIGSALYEAFRAEHPDLLVDLGPVGWRIPPLVAALLRKARPRPGRSSKLTGASAAISLGMALEQAELHRSACRLGA